MGIRYTPEQRERISNDSKGKVIKSVDWDDVDRYWVMTFEDGSEMSFRFVAELI